MLVLKHMESYKPILTEHYSVLVDPKQDELLGKYMGRYLESIHGELTTRFGYSPRDDPDRDLEGPQVVQRPDDRPPLHPDRRRLHR